MTMASKDDNKHKYASGIEEEAEASPKKQKMIGDDNDSSSIEEYSSELEEEEMNLPTGSEEELLIH
jgi:hypothetical protein